MARGRYDEFDDCAAHLYRVITVAARYSAAFTAGAMESFLLAVAARADAGRTPAAATPAAAITQPERPKWWNAYFGLQFLSRGCRRSLPPLSGAFSLEFLDRKEFWEGEMDELFVCHVAEKSSPTGEKEADQHQGRAPRHLCLTITLFESGVDALHGLPQFF